MYACACVCVCENILGIENSMCKKTHAIVGEFCTVVFLLHLARMHVYLHLVEMYCFPLNSSHLTFYDHCPLYCHVS